MITNIVNLTPHAINVLAENKEEICVLKTSGQVARCSITKRETGRVWSIPMYETVFGEVEGLPDPREETIFIVSLVVRQARPDRLDLYSPGELVRDEKGQPVGCIGLTR